MNFSKYYFNENESIHGSRFLFKEGGAYQHMLHPFEDDSLTFGEIKDMITKLLTNQIDFTEKVDGIQLSVSFKNGEIVFARNKTNLKNFGQNAMDFQSLALKFNDRGYVQEAFMKGATDLLKAFSQVSEDLLVYWFSEGQRWLSVEIIYEPATNVIPYKANYIVPHSLIEYDENGNKVYENDEMASKIFEQLNDNDFEFFIKKMPNQLTMNFDARLINDFITEVDVIKSNLTDENTIGDYRRLNGNVEPLEKMFLRLGKVVIENVDNLIVSDKEGAINDIRYRLQNKIKELEQSDNDITSSHFKNQYDKLNSIGGIDSILPSEGVVFIYNERKYKLVGSYAPTNRIMHMHDKRKGYWG